MAYGELYGMLEVFTADIFSGFATQLIFYKACRGDQVC